MILLFVASVVALALILHFGKRLKATARLVLIVLALLVNLPTLLFLLIGDKPLPGARAVTQEELHQQQDNE